MAAPHSVTARMGPVIQNAFVVRDLAAAVAGWVALGVGPFFAIHDSSYATTRYRGAPACPDFSIALAYWGDIQIELIELRCDTPSVYREFLDEGREGFHHMLIVTDDLAGLIVALPGGGHELLAESDIGANGKVIYFRPARQHWPLVEVGEFTPAIYDLFDVVKNASRGWDGRDPLRLL